MRDIQLSIFASGSGTNAANIIQYFKDHNSIKVKEVLSNRRDALVHQKAKDNGVPSQYFTKTEFHDSSFLNRLANADYLILAGFLWLIPKYLVEAFPDRILNIHPSLLPKFGGKGMFGAKVHKAVIASGEPQSGITIHLVNEKYDEGKVLFQTECLVKAGENADVLAQKIHQLEYQHYPKVIEEYAMSR
ncbi:MAG: phosphoribosylglycinamide formyltransferase [Bacteroidota bacterium]